MLKRPVAAGDLAEFPFAGLAFLDGNTANVLWAMALTLAVLVLLVQILADSRSRSPRRPVGGDRIRSFRSDGRG